MTDIEHCPACEADLRGEPIPEEYLRKGYYGDWDGKTPRWYSRMILVEIPEIYDGGLYWMCPDCKAVWHRWPEGHSLRARAEQFWRSIPDIVVAEAPLRPTGMFRDTAAEVRYGA